jgi:hypothetical protein
VAVYPDSRARPPDPAGDAGCARRHGMRCPGAVASARPPCSACATLRLHVHRRSALRAPRSALGGLGLLRRRRDLRACEAPAREPALALKVGRAPCL